MKITSERYKNIIVSALILLSCTIIPNAMASNGLFALGYGAKQVGIAGSGVAFPQDALIASINPAGVVFVGEQNNINLQYFSPSRGYTVDGPMGASGPFPGPTVDSDSESFFIPSAAFSRSISSSASVGIAIYGNGGMNTDYATRDTPFGAGVYGGDHTGVDYGQVFANLNYSRRFADNKASWGLAAIINYSFLRMNGLSNFADFSVDPDNLSDNRYDHAAGFGLRFGVLAEVTPSIRLGASYQTKIKNTFDDYAGLFTHGGEFDIPAHAQIGLAADVGQGVFTADIQQIQYSQSDAIGNSSRRLLSGGRLGDKVGFGWNDMTIYKLGYTWSTQEDLTWRIGASYGQQPIPSDEVTFNIVASGTIEHHYTAGFTKTLESGNSLDVAIMYAPEKCVSGGSLFVPNNAIELCMDQFSIDVGFGF
jgi:long-chain fatty acid transport protein